MYLTMKPAHSLALLVMAALTMPSALADFHVLAGRQIGTGGKDTVVCPSNFFNCKCFLDGQRRALAVLADPTGTKISTIENLCGVGPLDFYKLPDGHWDFYIHNGDGSLQGRCYKNIDIQDCKGNDGHDNIFYDQMVCYSYICGHA
ncbi:hypothetical protein BS47DRAFT_1195535 [Hydnum rufescens UP504]|uniref:Cyanovirin-N domain-containing protein n=1 Tax=Hydnum rufescens UP504 TaxID=1448309 RepID=A0A9P6ASL8_9AGAM|nr:hypothetical protein BS47DRAFT_1195535 [Hydnum rufescens UP504]